MIVFISTSKVEKLNVTSLLTKVDMLLYDTSGGRGLRRIGGLSGCSGFWYLIIRIRGFIYDALFLPVKD